VVDALFLVARRDISAGQWERFEGLIDSLISSLEKVLMAGHNQWLAALNAALQRKKITVHLKSIFEVVYKIFINYPQDREVAARLGKMGTPWEASSTICRQDPGQDPGLYLLFTAS
jgi:hypothetical protein